MKINWRHNAAGVDEESRRVFVLLQKFASLVLAIFLTLLPLRGDARDEVVVGVIWPLTGVAADQTANGKYGIDFAVKQLSATSKTPIRFEYFDNKSRHGGSLAAFSEAVNHGVVAIIAPPWSSQVSEITSAAWEKGIPLIMFSASNIDLTGENKTSFRVSLTDSDQAKALALFSINDLKKRKAVIVFDENQYSLGLRDEFARSYKALGGNVLQAINIAALTDSTNNTYVFDSKYSNENKDIVYFLPLYSKGARSAAQFIETKFKNSTYLIGDGFGPEFFEDGGDKLKNIYTILKGTEQSIREDIRSTFMSKMEKYLETQPKAHGSMILAYEAVNVLFSAIDAIKGPVTQQSILSTLRGSEFNGITGSIKFDVRGELIGKVTSIMAVSNGSSLFVRNISDVHPTSSQTAQFIKASSLFAFVGLPLVLGALLVLIIRRLFFAKYPRSFTLQLTITSVVTTGVIIIVELFRATHAGILEYSISFVCSTFAAGVILLIKNRKAPMRSNSVARMPDRNYDFFISYSREPGNQAWVSLNIYAPLIKAVKPDGSRYNVFMDTESIDGGSSWFSEIVRAIDSSLIFVPIYSDDFFSKEFCVFEMEHAVITHIQRIKTGGFVFPIARKVVDIPNQYKSIQFIDSNIHPDFIEKLMLLHFNLSNPNRTV